MARGRGGPALAGQPLMSPMLDDRNDTPSARQTAGRGSGTAPPTNEDVAYASRIWQAGGAAELHVWPGGFHGFDVMVPQATISRQAIAAESGRPRRLPGA
jgi:acetyl esterase/lipase